jgi:hypothetical protein
VNRASGDSWNAKGPQSSPHLASGARGKGKRQNLLWIHRSDSSGVGDPVSDCARLSSASSSNYGDRSAGSKCYSALIVIECAKDLCSI